MKHFKIYLEARTLVLKNLLQNWVNTNCDCCCIIYCCCCAFFNYICRYCCRCCINCCCKLSCMVSFLFSVAFSRDSNVLANFPCVFSIQEFLVLFSSVYLSYVLNQFNASSVSSSMFWRSWSGSVSSVVKPFSLSCALIFFLCLSISNLYLSLTDF